MKRTLVKTVKTAMLTAATIAALSAIAVPAHAQAVCAASRERMADLLGTRFGETMTAAGVDQNGNLVQVFSSDAGSWTIVVTIPAGPTCLLSAGDGWTYADDREPPGESPGVVIATATRPGRRVGSGAGRSRGPSGMTMVWGSDGRHRDAARAAGGSRVGLRPPGMRTV